MVALSSPIHARHAVPQPPGLSQQPGACGGRPSSVSPSPDTKHALARSQSTVALRHFVPLCSKGLADHRIVSQLAVAVSRLHSLTGEGAKQARRQTRSHERLRGPCAARPLVLVACRKGRGSVGPPPPPPRALTLTHGMPGSSGGARRGGRTGRPRRPQATGALTLGRRRCPAPLRPTPTGGRHFLTVVRRLAVRILRPAIVGAVAENGFGAAPPLGK